MGSAPGSGPFPSDDDRGRVVPFRPRRQARMRAFGNLTADDIAADRKATAEQDAEDYVHRMKMNALAVVALTFLIVGGMWIVDTMAQVRRNQDCVLSGRRDCAQIALPPGERTAPVPGSH